MSEQDLNPSSRLEAVLLDKLARQEERLSMLEAMLEETSPQQTARKLTSREDLPRPIEPGEHSPRAMSFEAPAKPVGAMSFEAPVPSTRAMSFTAPARTKPDIETPPPVTTEREPVRLPEFTGPRVDAIAELVQDKAAERRRSVTVPVALSQATDVHAPLAEEVAEPGYERTVRMNAPLLRRSHYANKGADNSMLRKAGSMALLSVAVAAMGVGLWQRQSAVTSASTSEMRPMPLLTPPAPLAAPHPSVSSSAARPSTPLRSAKLFSGKPPVLEPQSGAPASLHHSRRIVSLSTAAASGVHSHLNSAAPHTAAHSFAISGSSHVRQTEQKQIAASAHSSKAPRMFRSHMGQAGASEDNAQSLGSGQTSNADRIAERSPVSRANGAMPSTPDTTPDNPQSFSSPESHVYKVRESRRRRVYAEERERAEAARRAVGLEQRHRRISPEEPSEETQSTNEPSPPRQLQGNTRRAMKTLDEMRDLLDSIERRKRRQADAASQ